MEASGHRCRRKAQQGHCRLCSAPPAEAHFQRQQDAMGVREAQAKQLKLCQSRGLLRQQDRKGHRFWTKSLGSNPLFATA